MVDVHLLIFYVTLWLIFYHLFIFPHANIICIYTFFHLPPSDWHRARVKHKLLVYFHFYVRLSGESGA